MPRRGASGAARSKHLFADRDTSKPRPWLVYAAIGTVALIGVVLAGRQWLAIGVNSCGGAETHWRSVEAIGTQAAFEDHLARFSECQFAGLARARIATVELDRRALADEQRKRAETEARQAEQAERKSRMGQPLSPALERALKARDIFKECEACPEMIVIPAGTFTMGSPESEAGRNRDEGPQRSVTIARPLGVGRFAVTFEQWDACVADSGCTAYRPSDEGWGRGRQPVVNVSWNDARAYVAWLARKTGKIYRLLSEAEREYVTRAGTTTPFWWGNSISTSQANYDGNSAYAGGPRGEYRGRALPVESFDANPWGLHQVHGNVWEWVEDCWNESNR